MKGYIIIQNKRLFWIILEKMKSSDFKNNLFNNNSCHPNKQNIIIITNNILSKYEIS